MNLNKAVREDRSGISTILMVVIVVAILVVAAAAVYVVMSKDNGENDDGGEIIEKEIAPGTMLEYEILIDDVYFGTFEMKYEGQNADEYFMSVAMDMNLGPGIKLSFITYGLSEKGADIQIADPKGEVKKVGTETRTTVDGRKTLDKWEFTEDLMGEGGTAYAYIDSANGLPYVMEIILKTTDGDYTMVMELKDYELEFQGEEEYEESNSIGKFTRYALSSNPSLRAQIRCVADCVDGKYGVVYDFKSVFTNEPELYFLSDTIDGLITGAKHGTGDEWVYTDDILGYSLSIYYDAVTESVYKFIYTSGGTSHTFDKV